MRWNPAFGRVARQAKPEIIDLPRYPAAQTSWGMTSPLLLCIDLQPAFLAAICSRQSP